MSAPTLEEICEHVQVSPKALNQECTLEGQDILADYCGSCEKVAKKLFLSDTAEIVIGLIRKRGPEDQGSELVQIWVEKYAQNATYERFFKVLLELEQANSVKKAIKKLKEKKLLEQPPKELSAAAGATTLKLTESDQYAICQFLKYLPDSDVKKLGKILQLQSRTLEKMKDYPLDINVLLESIIKDACTWDHLIEALEKIGRDSEAKKIGGLYIGKKTFGDLGPYDEPPKEPAVVTLEEICENVKVSPKTLDQKCTFEGQDILADYCGDWEEVARKLFPPDTVDNLIDDVGKKKYQRSEFVRIWREEHGHTATYKKFFEALLELKFTKKVENALKKLREKKLLEQHPKEFADAACDNKKPIYTEKDMTSPANMSERTAASPELRVFRKLNGSIRDSIAHGMSTIATNAVAKFLIEPEQKSAINGRPDGYSKADEFLGILDPLIKQNPEVLTTFTDEVLDDLYYGDLIAMIKREVRMMKEKTPQIKLGMKERTSQNIEGSRIEADSGEAIGDRSELLPFCFDWKDTSLNVSTDKLWPPGSVLKVYFMESVPPVNYEGDWLTRNKIIEWMNEWSGGKSPSFVPKFEITAEIDESDVRVNFIEKSRSHSYLGRDAEKHRGQATMNLNLNENGPNHEKPQNYKKYLVLHVTGHALGFQHGHQHPAFGEDIFHKDIVMQCLMFSHGILPAKAEHFYRINFSIKAPSNQTPQCPPDKDSVMKYSAPKRWIKEKFWKYFYNDDNMDTKGYSWPMSALNGELTSWDKENADKAYRELQEKKKEEQLHKVLIQALLHGYSDVVEMAMNKGASVAVPNEIGQTIVHIAGKEGESLLLKNLHTMIPDVDELFLAKDQENQNILHYICAKGHDDLLVWLLGNIPKLKTKECLNQKSVHGYTPLLVACENIQEKMLKYLLEDVGVELVDITASTSSTDEKGKKTGLHLVAAYDMKEAAKMAGLLIEGGCPIGAKDAKGNTALHIAAKFSTSVCELLKAKGGDELDLIENNDGVIPGDIKPEDFIIPIEIERRGSKAVENYKRALYEGKCKVPYCTLLILGQERTGKTSLYRQLTGQSFIPNLSCTRGIDNNILDEVVEKRQLEWQEKDASYSSFEEKGPSYSSFLQTLVSKLEKDLFIDKKIIEKENVSREELKERISKIVSQSKQPLDHPHIPPSSSNDSPEAHSTPNPASPSTQMSVESSTDAAPTQLPPTEPLTGSLNREQQSRLNLLLRGFNTRDPSLVLNALDFAGQNVYRPMHHCFISRQALYFVVFDIEEIVKYRDEEMVKYYNSAGRVEYCKKSENSPDPFQELRYWLHSIHAHITPSKDSKEESEDSKPKVKKPQEKIFLVGTHKKGYDEDKLDEINELFENDKSRYEDHIHWQGVNRHFFAVENSIDKDSSSNYLKESGIEDLQNQLKEASNKLPFLKEYRPVRYLYLESCIESLPSVMNLSELIEVAKKCGIKDGTEEGGAFDFLHHTGKILWLKYLPRLFLHGREYDELKNLVILRRQWLFNRMAIIMEFKSETSGKQSTTSNIPSKEDVAERLTNSQKKALKKGRADYNTLQKCWEDFTSQGAIYISFKQLCLIFQAYCIIFPIDDNKVEYLIPSMFPELTEKLKKEKNEKFERICFYMYFDFKGFLPAQIYYQLVCLLFRGAKIGSPENIFTSTVCVLDDVKPHRQWIAKDEDCHWKVEYKRDTHKLIVGVSSSYDKYNQLKHIKDIHGALSSICQNSGLEGLEYYGGPLEVYCQHCPVLRHLPYVQYEREKIEDNVRCGHCMKFTDLRSKLGDASIKLDTDCNIIQPVPIYPKNLRFIRDLLKFKNSRHETGNGKGIKLAIIDDGFDHKNATFLDGDRFTFEPNNPNYHYHGTAVAAIAAGKITKGFCKAYSNPSMTYSGGVAFKAEVTCYSLNSSSLKDCLNKVAQKKFDVLSLSLIRTDETLNLDSIIEEISNNGTLIFAGAGNMGDKVGISYPASHNDVISVGSLNVYDKPSDFTRTSVPYPDVYTYGEMLVPKKTLDIPACDPVELHFCTGTSMATPAAAGLACLGISYAKKLLGITDDEEKLKKIKIGIKSIFTQYRKCDEEREKAVEMRKIISADAFFEKIERKFNQTD